MIKNFYAVTVGRVPGIYTDWKSCEQQVQGYQNAKFKKYKTMEEAKTAFLASIPPQQSKPKLSADDIADSPEIIKLFARGNYYGDKRHTGCGISLFKHGDLHKVWHGGNAQSSTKNQAELVALRHALKKAKRYIKRGYTVAVFSSSEYAVRCMTEWASAWETNKWRRINGEIKNRDLIIDTYRLYQSLESEIKLAHSEKSIVGMRYASDLSDLAIREKVKPFIKYSVAA